LWNAALGIEDLRAFYDVTWIENCPDQVKWSVGFIRKPDATNDAEYGVGSGFGVFLDAEMKPYYLGHWGSSQPASRAPGQRETSA
jgi:hypothetical protein